MAPAHKGKGKGREARPSRSRNTTPSSGLSSGPTVTVPIHSTSYLENDPSKLLIPSSQYAEVLDRMGGAGPIPDSKSLESLVDHLKSLSQMADARGDVCNLGIRELSQKRKEVSDEPEPIDREATRLKREMDEDDDALQPSKGSKGGKLKKRKERGGSAKEDHPLAHGAHEVSRQDGAETKVEGAASPASKKSKNAASEGNSPLSHSPSSPNNATGATVTEAQAAESPGSEESDDSHQPDPAPTVPQVQVFGSNPLKFDDPTIYHIREVTPDMTDEDKKEIYSVAVFPRSDLRDKMAGTPPDKDFSNAKPANQVSANTFQAYIEPFVRPLMEEDIAWLKEKGDRVTPFIMPPRGKKHYKEIWSEEDGALGLDKSNDERLPLNQGRGTIEQITDESAETDQVSVGPMVSRLYSLLRYEHRAPAEEGSATNGTLNGEGSANGGGAGAGAGAGGGASSLNGDSMEIDQPLPETTDSKPPLPSATAFPDASPTGFKVPAARLDHSQLDERLKAELRHVGFIGQDDNPDYDAHYDDDIAQRLRLLQSELKKQILTNNARKARLLDIARERMAYQEYTTIHDDLDTQVQQAYLKRSRTLGKSKKGSQAKNRPGAAGGAGAAGANHVAASVSRPAIGDVARTLMDRRKRWEDCIGPVFRDCKTTVPGNGETIFDPGVMAEYEKTEVEDDDQE